MDLRDFIKGEYNMNPCDNCIVDMICTQECPNFIIDLDRLQTDELIYLKRCMKNYNEKIKFYEITHEIKVNIYTWTITWHKNKNIHRDNDKPASITIKGTRSWYKNGTRHRDDDKPAVIWESGTRSWYKNGTRHRDNDQPAIIHSDGSKCWYTNGKLHRDNDQPAVIKSDGTKEFWKDGVQYELM